MTEPREPDAGSLLVFISYRREDSAGYAGRLYDSLSDRFAAAQLFMDVDTIEPGADFVAVISDAVGSCDALLAVIGPGWLEATNAAGERRLDDPNDFVRLEIEAALARNVRVIPVLVQGARMPDVRSLPASLAPLSRRNALEMSHGRWRTDADRLVRVLDSMEQAKRTAVEAPVVEPPLEAPTPSDAPPSEPPTVEAPPTEAPPTEAPPTGPPTETRPEPVAVAPAPVPTPTEPSRGRGGDGVPVAVLAGGGLVGVAVLGLLGAFGLGLLGPGGGSTPGPSASASAAPSTISAAPSLTSPGSPSAGSSGGGSPSPDGSPAATTGSCPALADDGTRIAFWSDRSGTADTELWVVDPAGTTISLLISGADADGFSDSFPAWSPDGTQVAFARQGSTGEADVYVVAADGSGSARRVTTDAARDWYPTWSPDGRWIAFASLRDGPNASLWAVAADGSGDAIRLTGGADSRTPAWSPDGSMIAYSTGPVASSDIALLPLEITSDGPHPTGEPVALTSGTEADRSPSWSPNGERLAFARDTGGGKRDIFVVAVAGSEAAQPLTSTADLDEGNPTWSPDGSRIAFYRGLADDYDIWSMDGDGGCDRPVTTEQAQDLDPSWR